MTNTQTDETKSGSAHRDDVPRKDAEWMDPIDDRILELFRERGNLNPAAVEEFGVTSKNHASRRCSTLAKYGLLDRIAPGLYQITDEGLAYLEEEFDPSTLEPDPDN